MVRCDMDSCGNGVKCGVVEWVKSNTLRWFGHIESKNSEKFVKTMYMSEIVGLKRRGK